MAIDPRDTKVIVGSSNDYCGVFNRTVDGVPQPVGPIWLGYYRSENGGASFQSSLVPGYPDDTSPYASRAQIRTATSGDPVLAWDKHGRLFAGAESSEDPAGTPKGFGDVWVATYENPGGTAGNSLNDGKEFKRSVTVARGSSAPGTGRQVQRQDVDRGRPHQQRLRGQRLLRRGRPTTATAATRSTSPARPTTARPSASRSTSARSTPRSSSRTSRSPATATST